MAEALVWGLGFTQAIEARWPACTAALLAYRREFGSSAPLGHVIYAELAANVVLGHLVAERSRGNPESSLDLTALGECLDSSRHSRVGDECRRACATTRPRARWRSME
ncbi:MAG: hypothetical protein QM767_26185 [Anaeromyxobacter sp.]